MEIDRYIEYLRLEKKNSAHTCKAYQEDLDQFRDFIREEFSLEKDDEITFQTIRSWVVRLMENDYNPRSVNRKISALRSYFKYLQKQKRIGQSPMARQSNLKESKKLTVPYSRQEIEHLLNPILYEGDPDGSRNRMMIELFYGCGMRLSELTSIETGDIDFERGLLRLTGKRNKQRLVPLLPGLQEQLKKYLFEQNKTDSRNQLLLTDKYDKKLSPSLVYRIINHYLGLVTDKMKLSPHVLRHTFATHLLEEGADISSVKEILGHSSLSSTQVYIHGSLGKLKSVYNRAHPRQSKPDDGN